MVFIEKEVDIPGDFLGRRKNLPLHLVLARRNQRDSQRHLG